MSTRPDYFATGEKARLIPVVADSNREVRATSVLLATMMAVPSFAERMLETVGQRAGRRAEVSSFSEVGFRDAVEDKHLRPDGFVSVVSGRGRRWTALVEAKIGSVDIDHEQVKHYAAVAKEHGIDAVITISNEFVALPSHSPVHVGRVLERHVRLFHWSWMFIVTEAMLLIGADEFSTPEQKFILSELVRYLSHESVGVRRFDRMNAEWRNVVLGVNARTVLLKSSKDVLNTVAAWHQECRDLSLLMTRKLHRRVRQQLSRVHAGDPEVRVADDAERLAEDHVLECALDIPDAADVLELKADIVRRCVIASMTLQAPDTKRAASRVSWLMKQLAKSDPVEVHIEAQMPGRAPAVRLTLVKLLANTGGLDELFGSSLPTAFTVMMIRDIAGRFSGNRTFIEEIEKLVPEFYENVGQHLTAFRPKPPQVKVETAGHAAVPHVSEGLHDVASAANDAAEEALHVVVAGRSHETSMADEEPSAGEDAPAVKSGD